MAEKKKVRHHTDFLTTTDDQKQETFFGLMESTQISGHMNDWSMDLTFYQIWFLFYLQEINTYLATRTFFIGERLTLPDILVAYGLHSAIVSI